MTHPSEIPTFRITKHFYIIERRQIATASKMRVKKQESYEKTVNLESLRPHPDTVQVFKRARLFFPVKIRWSSQPDLPGLFQALNL